MVFFTYQILATESDLWFTFLHDIHTPRRQQQENVRQILNSQKQAWFRKWNENFPHWTFLLDRLSISTLGLGHEYIVAATVMWDVITHCQPRGFNQLIIESKAWFSYIP